LGIANLSIIPSTVESEDSVTDLPPIIIPPFELELLTMLASGLHFGNYKLPRSRKPIAYARFVLNFNGVSVVMEVVEARKKYSPVDNIKV